jgi:hypothetical protein
MVPVGMQVPGLTATKVYAQYISYGTADCDAVVAGPGTAFDAVAPLKTSVMFEIPTGVNVDLTDLQSRLSILLSGLGRAISDGNVQPLDKVLTMTNGALLIK